MRNIILSVIVLVLTFEISAQNVDLNNSTDYIRVQKVGESGFSRAFGLNGSNQLYIGSVEKTIGNIHFFNKGTNHLMTIRPNGNVGIGTTNPVSLLDVNGDAKIGSLANRHYLRITSKEWPEIRFETPSSDRLIRLGVAHADNIDYGVGEGDFYVYSNTVNQMPMIVNKTGNIYLANKSGSVGIGTTNPLSLLDVNGDAKIGSLTNRHYLRIASKEWPEIRFETPSSDRLIRLGVAHADNIAYGVGEGDFYVYSNTVNKMPLIVNKNGNVYIAGNSGNVGIGTTNPGAWKLAVNGKIRAKEIKVETGWSDFVFYDDYKLPTLKEVEDHIKTKGHLQDIPSAKEVKEKGVFLGEMDAKLLQKIEELTLYTINQEKRINELEAENENVGKENEELKILANKFLKLQERLEKLESRK